MRQKSWISCTPCWRTVLIGGTPSQETDGNGMATELLSLGQQTAILKTRYIERIVSLNPDMPINIFQLLITAGDGLVTACRRGLVSQLERCFVTLCASINGTWHPDRLYSGICDEAGGTYNVYSRSPCCTCKLDFRNLGLCIKYTQKVTEEVDKKCLFAKSLGIEEGIGKGIVWKVATP